MNKRDAVLNSGIDAILESANNNTINDREAQLLLRHMLGAWATDWVNAEIDTLLKSLTYPARAPLPSNRR